MGAYEVMTCQGCYRSMRVEALNGCRGAGSFGLGFRVLRDPTQG